VIVIDASAVVELLLRTGAGLRVADDGGPLVAPHLLDTEVLHAFRTLVRLRSVGLSRAEAALQSFARLPLERLPHDVLRTRVWELRANLSAYDATYVAAAESLGLPLVTCDGRLARAPGHRATVEAF
jgi:predicted nucleic acid-binding protein